MITSGEKWLPIFLFFDMDCQAAKLRTLPLKRDRFEKTHPRGARDAFLQATWTHKPERLKG
jgi:hypothetical protein